MPHIVVEYSRDITGFEIEPALKDLHMALAAHATIDPTRIKARGILLECCAPRKMVHVTLKLLPRPDEAVKRMAQSLQEAARRHAGGDCAVTVETVTLNPDTYCA